MAKTSVYLNVKDVNRSLAFYQKLGFKAGDAWKNDAGLIQYVPLEMDGAMMALGDKAANPDPDFQGWVKEPLGQGIMVSFEVPDPKAMEEKVTAGGGVVESPTSEEEGMLGMMANDPDGYVLFFFKTL